MKNLDFDIMQNAQGQLVILFYGLEIEIEKPRFLYDGGEMMVFYPNTVQGFNLNIAAEARGPLDKAQELMVANVKSEEDIDQFTVPVRHIESLKSIL